MWLPQRAHVYRSHQTKTDRCLLHDIPWLTDVASQVCPTRRTPNGAGQSFNHVAVAQFKVDLKSVHGEAASDEEI